MSNPIHPISFCDLKKGYGLMKNDIDAQIDEVLSSCHFIMGPKITELEGKLAKYVGVDHCVSVSDGTAAIQVALMALGISAGDEVITVPFTWISTAEVVSLVGADTVFVDVEEETFNMDATKLEAAITPKTKAIIVVSIFGQTADFSSINKIAASHGIPVIEDAAQSFGASHQGQMSCSMTKIATTSFFPSKPFGCYGDGGAVFTNDAEIANKITAIRTHGANVRHNHWCVGMNSRLDAMQAGVLLGQWLHMPDLMKSRTHVGTLYSELLGDGKDKFTCPLIRDGNVSVYAQYTLKLGAGGDRDATKAALKELGIHTAVYYPKCLHHQPIFERKETYPVAESLADRVMSLPMHPWLSDAQIQYIAKAVRHVLLGEPSPSDGSKEKEKNEFTKSVAVIGAGYWGKNHVKTYDRLGALHTVCDAYKPLLDTYKESYPDANLEGDYSKVLGNDDITCVSIAAPAPLHFKLAKQALNAGKHVLVEKPMCLDITEAAELVALAEAKKCTLGVGHLLRYHPGFVKALEVARSGEIGKIRHITSNRMSLGKFRTEENVLWSFAPHDISMILAVVDNGRGMLPQSVTCMGGGCITDGVQDDVFMTMTFPNGVVASIHVSWVSPFKEQKLTIVGTEGMVVFDDTKPWDSKVTVFGGYIEWKDGQMPLPTASSKDYNKSGKNIPVEKAFALDREFEAFLRAVDAGTSPSADGKEGLAVLTMLHAAQTSMDKGGAIVCPKSLSQNSDYFVHETAVVENGCTIGSGSRIWHFTHVMPKCSIGKGCNLGQNVVLMPDCSLGNNVKVQNNVSVYGGVHCEDDVFLGPSMVFTNVKTPRSAVNRRGEYSTTMLKRGASVGANATIVCGITLGEYSFVGAGAVVTKDVLPFSLVVGNPAKHIGWIGRNGERLVDDGDGNFSCPATSDKYVEKCHELVLVA